MDRDHRVDDPPLVLAISAGGTKGMFAYTILRKLGIDVPGLRFDAVVGSSVGAVVGAMVATGTLYTLGDDELHRIVVDIFDDSDRAREGSIMFRPAYRGRSKRAAIDHLFGTMTMGDVWAKYGCHLMVLAESTGPSGPVVFSSRDPGHTDVLVADALDASTAIPVLFPSVRVGDLGMFSDGGTIARDPIGIGYVHLLARTSRPRGLADTGSGEVDTSRMRILDIGTTPHPHTAPTHPGGLLHTLAPRSLVHYMSSCAAVLNGYVADILGSRRLHVSVQSSAGPSDTAAMTTLRDVGEIVYHRRRQELVAFVTRADDYKH